MAIQYGSFNVVGEGGCIESIAYEAGFDWKTLWNHPKNSELKKSYIDPNTIEEGCEVFVPFLNKKHHIANTGQTNSFTRKSYLTTVKIIFTEGGEPREFEKYVIKANGEIRRGSLDQFGCMEESFHPNVKSVKLKFEGDDEITLLVGGLEPGGSIKGAQQRLNNLGVFVGNEDGEHGAMTSDAVSNFQQRYKDRFNLTVSGELDEDTIDALYEVYGS